MDTAPKIPPTARNAILAVITISLLILYAFAVATLVNDALCADGRGNCRTIGQPTELIATLQSVVSAIIIAVLAVTPSKSLPNLARFGGLSTSTHRLDLASLIALAYCLVWLVAGGAAFVVGHFLLSAQAKVQFSSLVDLGTSWLGLVIGAAYAYLGVEPKPMEPTSASK
ncbi:hypothetical protein [Caballeronia sp. AZ7_KS35]|uniref:hypothetical protein n=1 Tax=Caballeronia sp. AZ7_KS35 TaxID=2921762 RepID=UPI002027A979|nr:hypothetical protein [Caballeronia sp. AZ7_KS35]